MSHPLEGGRRLPLLAAATGVLVTLILLLLAWQRLVGLEEETLAGEAELIGNRLAGNLAAAINGAENLALLFQASERVDADEFEIFAGALLQRHPHITLAAYLPRVTARGHEAFEARMRDEGTFGFHIRTFDGGAAAPTGISLPVQRVAPFTVRNSMLLGLDLGGVPAIDEALGLAVRDGRVALARVGEGRLPPLLLIQPVYAGRYHPGEPRERVARLNGVILLGLAGGRLPGGPPAAGLEVELGYRPQRGAEPLTIHRFAAPPPTGPVVTRLERRLELEVGNNTFTLWFTKRAELSRLGGEGVLLALLAGALVTLLLVRRSLANQRQADELRRRNREISREVARQTAMLRQVLSTIPVRVFWKDREGAYLGCNALFARDAGLERPEQIVGRSDFDLPWRAQAERYRADDREVIESGRAKLRFEEPQIGPDGRELWLETSKIPLTDGHGQVIGMLGAYQEISERKAAERERERARREAEAASRAKSEFLANISHEIRTPMNVVLNLTRLVLEGETEPRHRDHLTKAVRAAEQLLGVFDDLLDYARIEAGRLQVESTPFTLGELLGDLPAGYRRRAGEKGLRLRVGLPEGPEECLVGDLQRLRQVLTNLLGNAIKFTERGEVALEVRRLEEGRAADGGRQVCLEFSVRDSGIGIAADQLDGLFQPFHQLDGSSTRRYGGTGLGLAISRRLVELMGGRLEVESRPGEGSRFHFALRLAVSERSPAPAGNGGGELRSPPLSPAEGDGRPLERESIVPLLAAMAGTLDDDLAEARRQFDRLMPLLAVPPLRPFGERIAAALAEYDTDAVRRLLAELADRLEGEGAEEYDTDGAADPGTGAGRRPGMGAERR